MGKKLDINELIWLLILTAFAFYFYKLIYTGGLIHFIHPKMFKYIYFSLIALAFMIIYRVQYIFKNNITYKLKLGYLLFLFILLIAFGVNPKGLNAQAAINRGIKIGDEVLVSKKDSNETPSKDTPIKRRPGGAIEVTDENYMSVMNEVNSNIEEYSGREITVTGFVYKDESYGKDKFIVARMMLNCCAADVEVVGYLCKYNGKDILPKEQWIKITGIIREDVIEDIDKGKKKVPVININKIERISEPENKYIYE